MRRKKGFSLVELLIVLAVMAALIATITPVALNAIKKAKATQVAQNLKTLASAFENKVYVDNNATTDVTALARDVDSNEYSIDYDLSSTSGQYSVTVVYNGTVDADKVIEILPDAEEASNGVKYHFEFYAY